MLRSKSGAMNHESPTISSRSSRMGWDTSSLQCGSKRIRPAEDEVYLDNYHVQKRYLSEVMASSLNGLKVGDSLSGGARLPLPNFDPLESPAGTETGCLSKSLSSFPSNGEELSTLDSYMSDDSDESICYRFGRYSETPQRMPLPLSEPLRPISPRIPCKSPNCSGGQFVATSCNGLPGSSGALSTLSMPLPCSQARQCAPDAESRFPPSPSDPWYSADLRRAALLRSLQMRAQSPVAISDMVAVVDCLDPCMQGLAESEDQCSPSSPNFDDSSAEQMPFDHDILGSPVHGTFSSQVGRVSGRARSLLLDECASVAPATCDDVLSSALEISSLHAGRSQADGGIGSDMNSDCTFSSTYKEEVSESTEKVGDVRVKKETSTPRCVLQAGVCKQSMQH